MEAREQLLRELERGLRLEATHLNGATAPEVTAAFTRVVVAELERRGYRARRESSIWYEGGPGVLDVAGYLPDKKYVQVAVELDVEYRERSVRKLSAAIQRGAAALWVRWGPTFPTWEARRVPAEIRRVEIPVAYRRLPRTRAAPRDRPLAPP
jgi:hypothetical protein